LLRTSWDLVAFLGRNGAQETAFTRRQSFPYLATEGGTLHEEDHRIVYRCGVPHDRPGVGREPGPGNQRRRHETGYEVVGETGDQVVGQTGYQTGYQTVGQTGYQTGPEGYQETVNLVFIHPITAQSYDCAVGFW
jgi:hypothetical protein